MDRKLIAKELVRLAKTIASKEPVTWSNFKWPKLRTLEGPWGTVSIINRISEITDDLDTVIDAVNDQMSKSQAAAVVDRYEKIKAILEDASKKLEHL